MKATRFQSNRNTAGIIFVIVAIALLVTGLLAQAQEIDNSRTPDQTVYESEFLGGLWAAHDGPNSRHRNFFPFYYEVGEGGNNTWSSPLLLSGGRVKQDGSEEIRLFGGLIRHSIDKTNR